MIRSYELTNDDDDCEICDELLKWTLMIYSVSAATTTGIFLLTFCLEVIAEQLLTDELCSHNYLIIGECMITDHRIL